MQIMNCNRNYVPKVKSNQDKKLVNRFQTLYSDYKSSETKDTSSDAGGLEISTDTSSCSILIKVKKKTKIPAKTEVNNKFKETRH